MKVLWCWRCKAEVPMLDEDEFKRVSSQLHTEASTKEQMFGDFLLEYKRITGIPETNPNAIFHHRASLYGRACSYCGKPLRSPLANVCASCGKPVARCKA